ncbi:MAG: NACHT domain-containing protein [Pseudonocardiaceae bacterium]|nr:NACHT domain-containing protein [Pseudonocardiaceae bacterium]
MAPLVDPVSSALLGALSATFSALYEWGVARTAGRQTQKRRLRAATEPDRLLAEAGGELTELKRAEFAGMPDGDWAAVQDAVAESLRAATIPELVESAPDVLVRADPLRERVESAGRGALASAVLDDRGRAAYQRLLLQSCKKIAKAAQAVDEMMRELHAETAGSVKEIKVAVDDITEQPDRRERQRANDFERAHLRYIAEDNATFELFQVSVGRAPARYAFDRFYAIPSIARLHRGDADTELTGTGTDGANAIGAARRVLLLGGAGAGKTTFLRWLAYTAAASVGERRELPWRDAVPFFIPLRQFPDGVLPEPEDLVRVAAGVLAGEQPRGWVSALLRTGRAMLLVDGVDELLPARRDKVRRWLADLVRAYPDARYVVSTRPSAVEDDWPAAQPNGAGFLRFELLPLSSNGLRSVIGHWYDAARDLETEREQQEWLTNCEQRLVRDLSTRPKVRTLVSSPLLCSLLCALYRRENMYLPQSRKELLDKALELLLGQWDDRRGVRVEDQLRMSNNEKIILLERFAAHMVRNSELMVDRGDAEKRFGRAMSGLRSQGTDATKVVQHMLERTGLLRERDTDGKIAFVHRTFRDFLAAGEFVKAGELGYLIEHAHDDSLNEVLFMAAAQARAREAGALLGGLLERATKRVTRKDHQVANRLVLLAAACLGHVDVIDPEQVRPDVLEAVRRLIPPGSLQDAEMLARAGSFVVDLLPEPIEVGKYAEQAGSNRDQVAANVIRALAMVGGEEAWEKIRAFTGTHGGVVIDELLRAWRQYDYSDDYARTLLSNVDFGALVLKVHRWDVLTRLRHLRTLTAVQLIGDVALGAHTEGRFPLAEMPNLHDLEMRSNEVVSDLSGLTGCRALRTLRVSGYSALRDMSMLAELDVEELHLHPTPQFRNRRVPELGTLTGSRLRRLSTNHPKLASGLHPLPADLPLEELTLDARAEQRSLLGVDRFPALQAVTANGVPSLDEVRALGGLPVLRRLVLHDARPVDDLVRLRPLDSVRVELFGVRRSEQNAVRAALPDAVVHVSENEPPDFAVPAR